MSRLSKVDMNNLTERQKGLLDKVQSKMGKVPNMMATLAQSPAALEMYLATTAALSTGFFSAKERELVALVVGEINECDYCVSAHTVIGKGAGLTDPQVADARTGKGYDSRSTAIVDGAAKLTKQCGFLSDEDLDGLKTAGLTDGEITELVAVVGLNIFTNYFNHVADPEIDFPVVKTVKASCCSGATSCC